MLTPKEHKRLENYIQDVDVSRLAVVFDALSDPNRCLIFRALLKTQHANVTQLAQAIGISNSLASQHLKSLREANLILKRKVGKEVYYHVNSQDSLVKSIGKVVDK